MPGYDPQAYEAWYHTSRGAWIADREFTLLMRMMRPTHHASLLDVGCGTGYFSRRFAAAGLSITGIDPDEAMLAFAVGQDGGIDYLQGDALALPFADGSFDHCAAITSLCFIDDPVRALREMLRIARRSIMLGLLNRHSRLYRQKYGRGGYLNARWDGSEDIRRWIARINPHLQTEIRSAVFFPGENPVARSAELCLSNRLPWGGFLAVVLRQSEG
ncbi:MAG: class I SAM-dependent methyltransferase [Gammaproteobacteria bacterium]|nr:class I SAM-dependent methyltransferase [Gammaproteobacteria bacterium]